MHIGRGRAVDIAVIPCTPLDIGVHLLWQETPLADAYTKFDIHRRCGAATPALCDCPVLPIGNQCVLAEGLDIDLRPQGSIGERQEVQHQSDVILCI